MINPITEQDKFTYYTTQSNTAASASAAQKTAEAATQTVQAASSTTAGGAQTAKQDTVELSARAQEMVSQAKTNAGDSTASAQAETAQDPAMAAMAQRVKTQASSSSAQSVSTQTSATEEEDAETNLSGYTEQQLSQLVSKGTISASQAAAELAKRVTSTAQTGQGDSASRLQAANTAAQTGLVLNAVA